MRGVGFRASLSPRFGYFLELFFFFFLLSFSFGICFYCTCCVVRVVLPGQLIAGITLIGLYCLRFPLADTAFLRLLAHNFSAAND